MRRRELEGELLPCSSIYSLPGLLRKVISAEEVEYLVPEANISLRPVEKYPHGCGGRGQLSVAGHSARRTLWRCWPLSPVVAQSGLSVSDSFHVLTACFVPPDTWYNAAGIRYSPTASSPSTGTQAEEEEESSAAG